MKKILVLGIENEFEGIGPMYFELSNPEVLVNYIKNNIERDQEYVFIVKEMDEKEFSELE